MNAKRLFKFVGTFIAIILIATSYYVPAKASPTIVNVTSWPVDVTQSDATWGAPIGMVVASGNPSWTSGFSVNGSSQSADFTMQYTKSVPGGIVDEVVITSGTDAHCPDGFALSVDPDNPDECAQKTSDGSAAYYIYADLIPPVDPVMGCPQGYALGVDPANPDLCAQVTNEGATHQVIDVPAHCPDGYALGVDPANPDLCAQVTNEGATHQELVTPAHCPNGSALGVDPFYPDRCAYVTNSGATHQELVTPAHCPDGYALGVDPYYPNSCAYQTNVGATHQVVNVQGHYFCPSGYALEGSQCKTWVSSGYWHYCGWFCDDYWVDTSYWYYMSAYWVNTTYTTVPDAPIYWYENMIPAVYQTVSDAPNYWYLGMIPATYNTVPDAPVYCYADMIPATYNTVPDAPVYVSADMIPATYKTVPDAPEYVSADMIPATYKTVSDAPVYAYADMVVVIPGVDAHCPDGYTLGLDTSKSEACAQLVPAVDATYGYADMVPATQDIYGCPEGTTETEGECQLPGTTEDLYVEYLLNLPVPVPAPSNPVVSYVPHLALFTSVEGFGYDPDPQTVHYCILVTSTDGPVSVDIVKSRCLVFGQTELPSDFKNPTCSGPVTAPAWIPHDQYFSGRWDQSIAGGRVIPGGCDKMLANIMTEFGNTIAGHRLPLFNVPGQPSLWKIWEQLAGWINVTP